MELEKYLQINPKKHIIFDFDLTLGELVLPWNLINEKMDREFRKIDKEMAVRCFNWNWSGYNEMVKKYGHEVKRTIDKNYLEFETNHFDEVRPNKELISFVLNNHSIYTLYVWSNNQRPTVINALKKLGILEHFKKIVTATDVSIYKPEPEGFELIYDNKTAKDQYLMIGDSEGDRKAAKNVGIDFFFVQILRSTR